MTTFAFDMNDSELRIARMVEAPEVVVRSVGFAMINPRAVLLGNPALHEFRLHPRQASNQFWNRLSSDALSVRGPDTATFADLVYRQLRDMLQLAGAGAADELYIAVPGTTSGEQLGLLAGIAAEIGVPVTGLVDSAVAAASTETRAQRQFFIDALLHRLVITEIANSADVTRQRFQDVADLGTAALMEAWVNVAADRFVRDTRFDPLRIAATDQQLYSQLHAWLTNPARAHDLSIEIDHQGTLRRTDLTEEAMIAKVTPRYRQLDSIVRDTAVLLSHRAAQLPGLRAHLAGSASEVIVLEPDALFLGMSATRASIRSSADSLRLVTRLPSARTATGITTPAGSAPALATHVLCGFDAVAIVNGLQLDAKHFPALPADTQPNGVRLSVSDATMTLHVEPDITVTRGDQRLRAGATITKGDMLEINGTKFMFICVHGTA